MGERQFPIVVRHSPIEFVLTGPYGGRDRVLVRTENAGLDLVALSAQIQDLDQRSRRQFDPIAGLLGAGRQVHVVCSMHIPDFRPEADSRRSRLSLAWSGLCSPLGQKYVIQALNTGLPDLYDALDIGGADEVEYAIAPIVLVCSEQNERRFHKVRLMRFVLGAYVIVGIAMAAYQLGRGYI